MPNAAAWTFGSASGPPFKPTRDQVCSVNLTFNNLRVQTEQFGALNWFEVALDQLRANDRESVYSSKHAHGDTHQFLAVSHRYDANGIMAPLGWGYDWTQNLDGIVSLATEVISHQFVPTVFLAGDGQSVNDDPQFGEYNDPVGWTYGYQWLMQNLERLLDAFDPIGESCLFVPGFDAVFYGWTPEQVTAFGALFRKLRPAWHLGIEHNSGHIPIGNGASDYEPNGPMMTYDVLLSEFDFPPANDTVWQVAARTLGPAYVRPSDQPSGDDPPLAPFYLAHDTPRGKFYTCGLEWEGLYYWIRELQTQEQIDAQRDYLRDIGYTNLG